MSAPSGEEQDAELTEDLEATPEEAEQVKGGYDIYKYRKDHKDRREHRDHHHR